MMERLIVQVEELLEETAEAHHVAFAATNGEDRRWAHWYATYLEQRLPAITGRTLSVQDLSKRLRTIAKRHENDAPDVPWTRFYAERLT